MSYFTEILAELEGEWRARDLDVRDYATLEDLTEIMRTVGDHDGDALAVIEHEDEWFALVRLTSDDELKVFISDSEACAQSPFADLFAEYLDHGPRDEEAEPEEEPEELVEPAPVLAEADEDEEEAEEESLSRGLRWCGDADVFADRDVPVEDLLEQIELHSSDPARVVAHVGEAVGFAEQLEAVR